MDVFASLQLASQLGILRSVCGNPDLDLSIIRPNEAGPVLGNDTLAELWSLGLRQVLQVGTAARKAAGLGTHDPETAMDAPGRRADTG